MSTMSMSGLHFFHPLLGIYQSRMEEVILCVLLNLLKFLALQCRQHPHPESK